MHRTLKRRLKTILVAMSGGVDSAVAAALLVREGHTVIGATMRHFCFRKGEEAEIDGRNCCSLAALGDARKVCARLGITHRTLDVESRFRRHVVDDFRAEYLRGRTPNPCVRCNQHVRFPVLLDTAKALGAAEIATGHYARIDAPRDRGGDHRLRRGVDPARDQSYFLWTLDQRTLARTRFPLGGLTKPRVRALARDFGIPVAEKPDSQEICFVPGGDYRAFLERPAERPPGLLPGPIVDTGDRVLGRHKGTALFTIGQRRGTGISGRRAPLYVTEIRPETGTIVVGEREALLAPGCHIEGARWIAGRPPSFPLRCAVRLRHRQPTAGVRVDARPGATDRLEVRFDVPQEAVAPGQSAVFYAGETVLGGGLIAGTIARRADAHGHGPIGRSGKIG